MLFVSSGITKSSDQIFPGPTSSENPISTNLEISSYELKKLSRLRIKGTPFGKSYADKFLAGIGSVTKSNFEI